MIRDLNVFESPLDVFFFLYTLNFDMVKDLSILNGTRIFQRYVKYVFLRVFLLKYLGNFFSLEYEGHIKIKRKQCIPDYQCIC